MKNISLSVLASVATFATLEFCGGSALAQGASPAVKGYDGTKLDEITVIARRREENLQKVPVAVIALGSSQLKDLRVTEMTDLSFSVPNLQIWPGTATPSAPLFVLRGQQQSLFTDANVVTYVNDVPQSTRGLTFFDMASVQALKGPQGTLFGKNSNGGAMVFQTKQPVYKLEGFLEGEYGNYNRRSFTGTLNLPLIKDKVALRVSGEFLRRDGVFKNVYPGSDDMGNRHSNAFRALLLVEPTDRLKTTFQGDFLRKNEIQSPLIVDAASLNPFNPAATIVQEAVTQQSALGGGVPTLNLAGGVLERGGSPFVVRQPTGLNTTIPLIGVGGVFGPFVPWNAPIGNGSKLDVYGVQNVTTYELTDSLTLKNIFGYRNEKSLDHSNSSGTPGFTLDLSPVLGILAPPGGGQVTLGDTSTRETHEGYTEEFQVLGKFENLNFIVGGFFSDDTDTYAAISLTEVGPSTLITDPLYFDINQDSKSYAVFGQGTYDLSSLGLEGLSITGGLRQTWDRRKFEFTQFSAGLNTALPQTFDGTNPFAVCNLFGGSGAGATAIVTSSQCLGVANRNTDALTWTASLAYQVRDDTLLYFTSRKGYKAGRGQPTPALDYALHGPEYLRDMEVGVKHEGRVGSVSYRLNIDAFRGKYKDIQVPTVLSFCSFPPACTPGVDPFFGSYLIFNNANAVIQGVEIDGVIAPLKNLTFTFGYSFQDTKYGKGSSVPAPLFPGLISPANPLEFGALGNVIEGKSFGNVPKHQFNVSGSYTMSFVPARFARPVLTAHYAWRGKELGQPALGAGAVGLPKFGVLNARLSFDELFETGASLSFWAQNVLNKEYELIRVDNTTTFGYVSTTFGDPRTYGLSLSYAF